MTRMSSLDATPRSRTRLYTVLENSYDRKRVNLWPRSSRGIAIRVPYVQAYDQFGNDTIIATAGSIGTIIFKFRYRSLILSLVVTTGSKCVQILPLSRRDEEIHFSREVSKDNCNESRLKLYESHESRIYLPIPQKPVDRVNDLRYQILQITRVTFPPESLPTISELLTTSYQLKTIYEFCNNFQFTPVSTP